METGFDYERGEIQRALNSGGAMFRLKVEGDDGASKWLNVTRSEVERLRDELFPERTSGTEHL